MAAAAEARTQTPVKGVDASSLDRIEKAQRAAGHGEWWCAGVRILYFISSTEGAVFFWFSLFFQNYNFSVAC